jgi:hypothetical protein
MWLVTPIGFFSIVQKPGDKQNRTLTVRSRVRSDLAALKQHYLPGLGPIQESHDTDYRFRAVAPRSEVSAAMAHMVDGLDYSNFKSEVAKKQGHKRASLYHKVWDVLYHLQRIGNPMGFRGVWLTPGAAVNRRLRSGMCRD